MIRRLLPHLIPIILFAILAIFLYRGLYLNPRDLGSTRIDKPAPAFTLPEVSNVNKMVSEKEFLGKISLLNVWASWCVTCRYEHPLLVQLAKQKFNIYGLNYKDQLADARATLAQSGNPYLANAFDEKGLVGIDWGVTGTPETFVIDQQGIVRYKHTGQLTVELLQSEILPLIKRLEGGQI